MNYWKL